MKDKEFKTNIMCGSCIAKVTPAFNQAFGENSWKIDTQNPNKILTVLKDAIKAADVINVVEKTGYKAEEWLHN